jgi:hypothetical protein
MNIFISYCNVSIERVHDAQGYHKEHILGSCGPFAFS